MWNGGEGKVAALRAGTCREFREYMHLFPASSSCVCMCTLQRIWPIFACFARACVHSRSRLLIICRQLRRARGSSHSGWCMLIERPRAKTGELIYKRMQLVLWRIDLPASPSVKRSPALYSEWQQVIKEWVRERERWKCLQVRCLAPVASFDIHASRRILAASKS